MANKHVEYVEGFLKHRGDITLIRKVKPEWMKGKLNGVGGHIEKNETPLQAMVREFGEEAGIHVVGWRKFLTLMGKNPDGTLFTVHFFECEVPFDSVRPDVTSLTEEKVMWYSEKFLHDHPSELIDNLRWIIPMAMDKNRPLGNVQETE